MNPAERELLLAFDRRDQELGDSERGDALGLGVFGDAAALRPVAEELAARGWLRRGNAADSYGITEEGRLALAGPLDLTLYTRPGCHLCDEAKAQIAPLVLGAGARLREVNIDADPLLRSRYDFDVPVLFLGARKVAKHRVDLRQLQRQLEEAARGPRG